MLNAVNYAAANGFEAVTCGHTHFAEEHFVNEIKYLNTGAWTEQPTYYVRVTDNEITLKKTADSAGLKSHRADFVPAASAFHQNPAQPIAHHS
jgi:predicted phosphodiesterase